MTSLASCACSRKKVGLAWRAHISAGPPICPLSHPLAPLIHWYAWLGFMLCSSRANIEYICIHCLQHLGAWDTRGDLSFSLCTTTGSCKDTASDKATVCQVFSLFQSLYKDMILVYPLLLSSKHILLEVTATNSVMPWSKSSGQPGPPVLGAMLWAGDWTSWKMEVLSDPT